MTDKRTDQIVAVFKDAFDPLMKADPHAFRTKYRKMAVSPHAFYRGSACLFYADQTAESDPYVDEQSGAIWIHGDLHVENFGTYLNSDGRLVFDINDFDEAYIGHFTWDLRRFAASLALLGWQKALPQKDVESLVRRYLRAYLSQVDAYAGTSDDEDFALHLDNTEGPILEALLSARSIRRADLLDGITHVEGGTRVFTEDASIRHLPKKERRASRRRSRATWRRSRSPSGSTGRSSTTCATRWASRASGSGRPASRRTTCWWRGTARPSTTTSCCR